MTKLQRVRDIYGPGNPIPVGKTNFFTNYVHDEKNGEAEQFIPGTNVPRLRLVKIGVRAVAAFDDEVAALVEGLRAARDKVRPKPGRRTAQRAADERPRKIVGASA
jgi:hypothetical protein